MDMASTSSSGKDDDSTKKKSIVIVDMPVDLIDREILKDHFEQFGSVERLACSVSKKYAVIHFSTAEEAQNAAANGTKIRQDRPPLKIFNRAIGSLGQPKSVGGVSAAPGSRVVTTQRKIVRTFSNTGGATTSFAKEPVLTTGKPQAATSSTTADVTDNAPDSESVDPSSSVATHSRYSHAPLKSSVKISRPSPFARRKPSFGDKTLKTSSTTNRNPFALPPRNKLTLDRRKITIPPAKSDSNLKQQTRQSDLGEGVGSSKTQESSHVVESACSSSAEIILPDEDEENDDSNIDPPSIEVSAETPGTSKSVTELGSNVPEVEPSSTLDIDETTEDAILNDDDEENQPANEQDDQENVFAEGETDTQDTAEVSTEEEEGEIQDDDEDDEGNEDEEEQIDENEDEENEDDAYESPLKRPGEPATASKNEPSSSSSAFSFKMSSTKPTPSSSSSGPSSASLFKLPFTSPFAALGDAPKPFSSSSFGIQLSSSNMSKIFAGSSTTATEALSSTSPSSAKLKTRELSKEKTKSKDTSSNSSTPPPSVKRGTIAEPEKTKAAPFGLFSSLSSFTAPKPSTATSASVSSSSKDTRPSLFAAPKSFVPLSSTAASNSGSSTPQIPKKSSGFGMGSSIGASSFSGVQQSHSQKDSPNPLLLSFNPDTAESQKLFSERANTVEERYRILEARDKLIRARIPKTKVNVEHATKLIGTCPDMCPEKERYMRQFQRQLVPYEMLPGQDHVVDHQKAIKVYSRSSADQEEPLPHELRPGPTLDFTMHYLLRYIVPLGDNPDENLSDWYNFLWDRTRSIRKDITQQQIIDLTAVSLYEKCARFHIHCGSRLCELDVHSFDPKLNDENLMKCLQSLEHLYEDLRRRQVTCPNEPEFRAYQIMMNLNEGDALYNAQQLPGWILNSPEVQTALKLHHSVYMRNFVAFFKTVETLPYMTSCILHRYFFQVRSLALRCFIKAHCTLPKYETAMPINTLQRMLGYGSAVQSFSYLCEAHGIHCDIEENKVIFKRKLFYLPEFPSIYRETYLIESKLRTSVAEAINGGPLPDIDFANYRPRTSFNDNGQLIPGDIVGSGTQESRPTTFAPPETISSSMSSSRLFSKPMTQPSAAAGGFSFSSVFSQPKKEPAPAPKPFRQIDSVCQAATAKLIEESVKQDVEKLSQARLEEAKRLQEQAAKRRLREEIATRLSTEYVDRVISQHIDTVVRVQGASRIRQFRIINEVTKNAADVLVDESVLINLGISARTELILAKEYHHRLIRTLQRIFQRVRARFVIQKWLRYTKAKILEREKEEEKRREELWNFPVINSYAKSIKDVFRAFCGSGSAQPSLAKMASLSPATSPENLLAVRTRLKRKSDGDSETDGGIARTKVARVNPEINYTQQNKMWDFPAINPYSRSNRQVLEAFCGNSAVIANSPVLSTVSPVGREKRKSNNFFSPLTTTPFKIHRPAEKVDVGRGLGNEIRNKANESNLDLLKNIQSFLSTIKDEKQQLERLEPYMESVEAMNKSCPEIMNVSSDSVDQLQEEEDSESELYFNDRTNYGTRSNILSGAFIEEENLLNQIQKFVRQVKDEKAKSWKTDTFLNDIDLSIVS